VTIRVKTNRSNATEINANISEDVRKKTF